MAISEMYDNLTVEIHPDRVALGSAAAQDIGELLIRTIGEKGEARVVFASAASQNEFLENLKGCAGIDWAKVVAFHQDEWVGVPMEKEYSFAGFIKKHLYDEVCPGTVYYLDSMVADMEAECQRYGALLMEKPVDIIILGIGENGHIAFNDPPEADFKDTKMMKIITLDETCRKQQQNDFGFSSIDDVPKHGITVTIPFIMACENIFAVVPGIRKAEAVAAALTGPISEACPASVLRTSGKAKLYLDQDSASKVGK